MSRLNCIPGPYRYPSVTGLRISDLLRYLGEIRGFTKIHREIKASIGEALKLKQPNVIVLLGEWGYGKTSVFETVLSEEADARIVLPILIPASTMLRYIEKIISEYSTYSSTSAQILTTSIIAAIKEAGLPPSGKSDLEEILNEIKQLLTYPSKTEHAIEYIRRSTGVINSIARKYGFKSIAIFIDEFEDISTYIRRMRESWISSNIVNTALSGLVDITNGIVTELNEPLKYIFIITVTPNIWASIKRISELEPIIGRIRGGRFTEIELKPLNIPDRYEFAKGVLKYSYKTTNDSIIKQIFRHPNYLNPILIASMGVPAFIQSILAKILEYRVHRQKCPPQTTEPIEDPLEYMEILEDINIEMYGASTPIVNRELYNSVLEDVRRYAKSAAIGTTIHPELLEKLFVLSIISNIMYPEDLKSIIGEHYKDYIHELNLATIMRGSRLRSYDISGLIFEGYTLPISDPALIDYLISEISSDKEVKRILSEQLNLTSSEEVVNIVSDLLNSMIYIDSKGQVVLVYLERVSLQKYIQQTLPYTIDDTALGFLAERIYLLINKVFKDVQPNKAFIINPRIIKIIYLSAELYYLDFITDRIARLDYWRRSLRLSEDNINAYKLGVLALLTRSGIDFTDATISKVLEGRSEGVYLVSGAYVKINYQWYPLNFALILSRRKLSPYEIGKHIDRINTIVYDHERHPHFILVISSDYESIPSGESLRDIEKKYILKVILRQIPKIMDEIRLISLGLKISDEIQDVKEQEKTVTKAFSLEREASVREKRRYLEDKGIDLMRLEAILDEISENMEIRLNKLIDEFRKEPSIIIEEPRRELTISGLSIRISSPVDLLKTVKYYLVYPEKEGTPREIYRFAINNIWRLEPFKYEAPKGRKYPRLLEPDIESEEKFIQYTCLMLENKILYTEDNKTCKELVNEKCGEENSECFYEAIGNAKIVIDKISHYEEKLLDFFKYIVNRDFKIPNKVDKIKEVMKNYYIITAETDILEKTIDLLKKRKLIEIELKQKGKPRKVKPTILIEYSELSTYINTVLIKIDTLHKKISEDNELLRKYGYMIVFSEKKRKTRHLPSVYLYENGLYNVLKHKIKNAIGDPYYFFRILTIMIFLYEIYSGYYRDMLIRYKKIFENIANRFENPIFIYKEDGVERKLTYDELINGIKSRLSAIFNAKDINIKLGEYNDLLEVHDRIKEIIEKELTVEDLEKIADEIESAYKKKGANIKDSGFAFHNPKYLYSAKIWLLLNDEKISGSISDVEIRDSGEIIIQYNPRGPLKKLEKLTQIYRKLSSLDNVINEIKNLHSKIDEVLKKINKEYSLETIPIGVEIKEELKSVDELSEMIDDITSKINSVKTNLEKMHKVLNNFSKLCGYLEDIDSTIKNKVELIKKHPKLKVLGDQSEVLELIKNIDNTVSDAKKKCGEILSIIEKMIKEKDMNLVSTIENKNGELNKFIEKLKPYSSRLIDIIYNTVNSQIESAFKNLHVIVSLFQRLETRSGTFKPAELVPSRLELIRLKSMEKVAALSDKYTAKINQLKEEYDTLIREQEERGKEEILDKLINLLVELSTVVDEALKNLDKYASQLINKKILSKTDYEVLKAYIEFKTNVSMISLQDAVVKLSEKTGLVKEEVKKSLLNLIDKGLIEVYI